VKQRNRLLLYGYSDWMLGTIYDKHWFFNIAYVFPTGLPIIDVRIHAGRELV